MNNEAISNAGDEKYTPADLADFYKRLEQYNSGEMQGFSMEEAHSYVRQNKR
jgi:hypothetical protein